MERNGTAKIKLMSIFNSNRSHQKLFSPKVVATDFLYQYLSVSVFYHLTGTGCITLQVFNFDKLMGNKIVTHNYFNLHFLDYTPG